MPKLKIKPSFTLIEILVVIAIIATLASAIIYSTENARAKSRDAHRKASLETLRTAAVAYYSEHGEFPTVCGEPGLDDCALTTTAATYYTNNLAPNIDSWFPALSIYLSGGKMPQDPNQTTLENPPAGSSCQYACRIGYQLYSDKKSMRFWVILENINDAQKVGGLTSTCKPTATELIAMNTNGETLYCVDAPPK